LADERIMTFYRVSYCETPEGRKEGERIRQVTNQVSILKDLRIAK